MVGVVKYLIPILVCLLFLVSCTSEPGVICNKPYILIGTECYLDADDNGIADKDEGKAPAKYNGTMDCPELDCSKCPAEVIEREKIEYVTKYVCQKDGREVEELSECEGDLQYNPFKEYDPYEGNEAGTVIDDFNIKPACMDGKNALEIYFELGSLSPEITIQYKEKPLDGWQEAYTLPEGKYTDYVYGLFCYNPCSANADFFIDPGKVYLMRAKFDFQELYDEYQFSNEYLIDARDEGEYLTHLC